MDLFSPRGPPAEMGPEPAALPTPEFDVPKTPRGSDDTAALLPPLSEEFQQRLAAGTLNTEDTGEITEGPKGVSELLRELRTALTKSSRLRGRRPSIPSLGSFRNSQTALPRCSRLRDLRSPKRALCSQRGPSRLVILWSRIYAMARCFRVRGMEESGARRTGTARAGIRPTSWSVVRSLGRPTGLGIRSPGAPSTVRGSRSSARCKADRPRRYYW